MRSFLRRSTAALALLTLASVTPACKDPVGTGELSSPADAEAFESKYRKAFDDDFTGQAVQLEGRAPNDVLDQQLFAERLGFSNVLATVKVKEVFGKGRYQGRQDQYVAIEIQDILMGSLPDETEAEQLLVIKGEDTMPTNLSDTTLLMFVRWAPEETPSYHHHLMPADDALLEIIGAMIADAKDQGYLEADGAIPSERKARKRRKKRKEAPPDDDGAVQ